MMRRLAFAALLCPATAFAQCTVSAVGVNFGSYDPFSDQHLDGTGRVVVACAPPAGYAISLGAGRGSYLARSMASGSHVLAYNLYTDATRTTVWGDGSASTAVIQASGSSGTHTIYGRIAGRQNVYAGLYADTVTVIVNF